MELILAERTKSHLDGFLKKPSHAVLISAPVGSGKAQVARLLSAKLLDIELQDLHKYPFFLQITPEANTITIETIRNVKSFLQLKTTGKHSVRRVLLIEDAETMTTEAQNALLKVLEEPPADTVLILTAAQPKHLLTTIFSRVQHLPLAKPTREQVSEFFSRSFPKEDVTKAFYMSNGRIGLMQALLNGLSEHPLAQNIDLAKDIFRKPVYERLVMINSLGTQDLQLLCSGLYSVAHAALTVAIEKEQEEAIRQWHAQCKAIQNAERQLQYRPQAKLLLTNLFMNV